MALLWQGFFPDELPQPLVNSTR